MATLLTRTPQVLFPVSHLPILTDKEGSDLVNYSNANRTKTQPKLITQTTEVYPKTKRLSITIPWHLDLNLTS